MINLKVPSCAAKIGLPRVWGGRTLAMRLGPERGFSWAAACTRIKEDQQVAGLLHRFDNSFLVGSVSVAQRRV